MSIDTIMPFLLKDEIHENLVGASFMAALFLLLTIGGIYYIFEPYRIGISRRSGYWSKLTALLFILTGFLLGLLLVAPTSLRNLQMLFNQFGAPGAVLLIVLIAMRELIAHLQGRWRFIQRLLNALIAPLLLVFMVTAGGKLYATFTGAPSTASGQESTTSSSISTAPPTGAANTSSIPQPTFSASATQASLTELTPALNSAPAGQPTPTTAQLAGDLQTTQKIEPLATIEPEVTTTTTRVVLTPIVLQMATLTAIQPTPTSLPTPTAMPVKPVIKTAGNPVVITPLAKP